MTTLRPLCLMAMYVSIASATPACVSGTLADYVDLGPAGCQVDGITLSGFEYAVRSTSNTAAPAASSIMITPEAGVIRVPIIGFEWVDESFYAAGLDFRLDSSLRPFQARFVTTPEPGEWVPCLLALAGIQAFARTRRRTSLLWATRSASRASDSAA